MSPDPARVIVVTGIQGAGKTTVGRLLAGRMERAAFIEADALQRMIVSGGAWVTDSGGVGVPEGEAAEQLRLRLHNACLLARSFAERGFSAVVDDIVIGERWGHLKEELSGVEFDLVVLNPSREVAIERDEGREKTTGRDWAEYLDGELRRTMAGIGVWVDSSGQTPEETVEEIVERLRLRA